MFARIQRPDGSLEPMAAAFLDEEPHEGAYFTLSDGRSVQMLGSARHPNGRLHYLVVVEASPPSSEPAA